jgi:hypothetical protein
MDTHRTVPAVTWITSYYASNLHLNSTGTQYGTGSSEQRPESNINRYKIQGQKYGSEVIRNVIYHKDVIRVKFEYNLHNEDRN